MMSLRLACELSDKIAGVASFAGAFSNKNFNEKCQKKVKEKYQKKALLLNLNHKWDYETCSYEKWS